jgi:Domain of unknown function (DUF4260)
MSTTIIIRLEYAATTIFSLLAYIYLQGPWWLFAVLFLVPDLSMLGYLAGPRVGANAYNLVHTSVLPLALIVIGIVSSTPIATLIGLIWFFHITWDRTLGYGLKLPTSFNDTHLGRIGRDARAKN